METKREVTKKFIIGVILMVSSLVLGKLVLIPLIVFPGSKGWKLSMLVVYLFSWLLMLIGIGLAGLEGYRLVTHKYKHYKRKTIHHVKNGSRKAARHVKNGSKRAARSVKKGSKKAARKVKRHSKKAAKKTKHHATKTRKKTRKQVDNFKKDVLKAEKQFQEVAHKKKWM